MTFASENLMGEGEVGGGGGWGAQVIVPLPEMPISGQVIHPLAYLFVCFCSMHTS